MANFAKYDSIHTDIESSVKKKFSELDDTTINNYVYEEMNHTTDINKIYIIKPPLYYLFDGYINEKIGSNRMNRNIINYNFNINELFLKKLEHINYVIYSNIHPNQYDIPHPTHATFIDKIENDNRLYIYYSNSGLGINNNHIYKYELVTPKLYYIHAYMNYI